MTWGAIVRAVRSRFWLGQAAGVASTFAALGARVAASGVVQGLPFLFFLPAAVLATYLGGLWAGVTAIVVGGLLADYFFIAPIGSLFSHGRFETFALFFYVLMTGILVMLTHSMIRAIERRDAAEGELRRLNADLEARVAERTAALEAEVAERAAAEGQIRQLQKMEAIGQLTGGVAHDFNNMLAIIVGSLDMARRKLSGAENPQVARCLDNASEGAQRATTLTARLLAFSRRQPLQPQVLDANKLASGVGELLRRTLGEGVRVETVLGGGLWRVHADPGQLETALVNLAVNGRDAMPEGGRLTVETANFDLDERYARSHADVAPGQYVMLSVTDTGTGMAPDVIERAFDPFFTTKGVGKGTGLGLSQVFGFVKQSGGHVTIYSEVGRGATIRLYLPRYVGAEPAVERAAPVATLPTGDASTVVLVAEDEAQVRQMSVDALRELGYTVVHAPDGASALEELVRQPRVDLLFTDIVMPGITGRELADRARETRPDLKVLFTTGYTRNAVVHNGVLDQGVALLPKPFTLAQLAVKVRDVLAG